MVHFIGVICRRERIKTSGNLKHPKMCKNAENGAKLLISTKYAVEKRHGGHRTGGTRADMWCDFEKRYRASARGTTVTSSRRAV